MNITGRASKNVNKFPSPDYQHTIALHIPESMNFIVGSRPISIPSPVALHNEMVQSTAVQFYEMFGRVVISEVRDVRVDFTDEKFDTVPTTVITGYFTTVTKNQITNIWELAVAIRDALRQTSILLTYDNMGWHV